MVTAAVDLLALICLPRGAVLHCSSQCPEEVWGLLGIFLGTNLRSQGSTGDPSSNESVIGQPDEANDQHWREGMLDWLVMSTHLLCNFVLVTHSAHVRTA